MTGYVSTAEYWTGKAESFSTLAPSEDVSGTIFDLIPSATGYDVVATSYYSGPLSTSTRMAPSDGTNGQLVIYSPSAGTVTTTYYYPATQGTATFTSVLATASNSVSGTLEVFRPSAGTVYSTYTSGGVDTFTTVATASAFSSGEVDHLLPEVSHQMLFLIESRLKRYSPPPRLPPTSMRVLQQRL